MTETAQTRGASEVRLSERPLIICDVDEVALEFITPFTAFLRSHGQDLLPRSFRLTGNIVSLESGHETPADDVRVLLDAFFASQMDWQTPAHRVATSLAALNEFADIFFLTAMPVRHYDIRRALLDRHDLPFPLVATEQAKGPLIAKLHDSRSQPLFFIDDLAPNLHSAKQHAPTANLLHYMANDTFRAMAPDAGDDVKAASNWREIEEIISNRVDAGLPGDSP